MRYIFEDVTNGIFYGLAEEDTIEKVSDFYRDIKTSEGVVLPWNQLQQLAAGTLGSISDNEGNEWIGWKKP